MRALDIFRYNGISDAAFNYIYAPTSTRGVDRETVLSGNIAADLGRYGVKSPFADSGVGFVLGFEHRYESLEFKADALAIQKGTTETSGRFSVNEVFAELQLPLIENRPFFKDLSFNAGYRGSDYSNLSKIISTYKTELSWRRPATCVCAAATTGRSARPTCRNCSARSRTATSMRRILAPTIRAWRRPRRSSSASAAA